MSIKIENLCHTYDKGSVTEIKALKNINYEFPDRFFTAVLGETGSGKSTFVQHFNGLLKPNKGRIIIDGFVLSANKKENSKNILDLRRKIGYLFQFSENQLFESTILKDVMFGPLNYGYSEDEAKQLAIEALKTVGIGEDYYERSIFELSGGEKRKVALAGILSYKPSLLILDEPTAGLDNETKNELLSLLKKLYNDGINIIIITHDMDVVLNVAKDVIVFSNGEISYSNDINSFFSSDIPSFTFTETKLIKSIKILKELGFAVNFNDIRSFKDLETFIRGIKK